MIHLKDGKVVVGGDGKPIDCFDCPCKECNRCECCNGGDRCFSYDTTFSLYQSFASLSGSEDDITIYNDSFRALADMEFSCDEYGGPTWTRIVTSGTTRVEGIVTYNSGFTYTVDSYTLIGGDWTYSRNLKTETGTVDCDPVTDETPNPHFNQIIWSDAARFAISNNKCCKDPDSGRCRCLPTECDGKCKTCFGLGGSSFMFEFECCMDYRSEVDATMSGFYFDLSVIADAGVRAAVGARLVELGLVQSEYGDDVYTGSISKHAVFGSASFGITWITCGVQTETLTSPYSTDGWNFRFNPYSWTNNIIVKNDGEAYFQINGSTSASIDEDNNYTCCGGSSTDSYSLTIPSIAPIVSPEVTFTVAIKKNKCCNCRGSNRAEGEGIGSYGICGPTSDGSNAVCEGDPSGDDNTCSDESLGIDSSRKNICSSTQDAGCLPVCHIADGVPDTLVLSMGGATVPLTRVGNQWVYSCCDGYDSSDCNHVFSFTYTVHHDAVDYDYECDWDYDLEQPIYCHYHADAYDETVTISNTIFAVQLDWMGCGRCDLPTTFDESFDTVYDNRCFMLSIGIPYGGCGQTNPGAFFSYAFNVDTCDDPRATYHLNYAMPDADLTVTVS